MVPLANATSGKTAVAIGADELRQAKPFGHKRSEGPARMEDLFQLMHVLYERDGPINPSREWIQQLTQPARFAKVQTRPRSRRRRRWSI